MKTTKIFAYFSEITLQDNEGHKQSNLIQKLLEEYVTLIYIRKSFKQLKFIRHYKSKGLRSPEHQEGSPLHC